MKFLPGLIDFKFPSLMKAPLYCLAVIFILVSSGCGSGSDLNAGVDTDGDGFSDAEEEELGTSPLLSDTDGDGFSDFQEIRELGFSAANNNFRFNPLISDVPKVAIQITSIPDIAVNYETTSGTAQELEVTRASSFSESTSVSDTTGNSRTIEESHSVGAEVGYEAGIGGGISGSVSYEYTNTHTNESSFSNTEEQAEENSSTFSEAEGLVESEGVTLTGGSLGVTVTIKNEGAIAFGIESLEMGAVLLERGELGLIKPIGNLKFGGETFGGNFGPGQARERLVFDNDQLSLAKIEDLMLNASALTIGVANSNLTDEFGTSFTARETAIQATTAAIIIDFGNKIVDGKKRSTERYRVATAVDNVSKKVNGLKAIEEILKIDDMVFNGTGAVSSIRGVGEDELKNAFWLISYVTSDGVDETIEIFKPFDEGYNFGDFNLKAGDILQLTYLEDEDGDGLGTREEFFSGTDPTVADTDDDGLTDGEEVRGNDFAFIGEDFNIIRYRAGSDPQRSDTDGDLVSDDLEVFKGWNPSDSDTDGDGQTDKDNLRQSNRWHNDIDISKFLTITTVSSGGKEFPRLSLVLPSTPAELRSFGLNIGIFRQVVPAGSPLIEASTAFPSSSGDCAGTEGTYCYRDNQISITEDNTNGVVFTFDDSEGALGNQLYNYRIFVDDGIFEGGYLYLGDFQITTAL